MSRALDLGPGLQFLFQMLNFMVYVVSTVFCGHLGTVELAASKVLSEATLPDRLPPISLPCLLLGTHS